MSKITVKVRFNASREKFEKFGNGTYIVYLPFEQDEDTANVLVGMLSKSIGLPVGRIEYAGQDVHKNWIFELV